MEQPEACRNIGERVRCARVAIGWTQLMLSARCECSQSHIAGLESGRLTPSVRLLRHLCCHLHVSADYLLFGGQFR